MIVVGEIISKGSYIDASFWSYIYVSFWRIVRFVSFLISDGISTASVSSSLL